MSCHYCKKDVFNFIALCCKPRCKAIFCEDCILNVYDQVCFKKNIYKENLKNIFFQSIKCFANNLLYNISIYIYTYTTILIFTKIFQNRNLENKIIKLNIGFVILVLKNANVMFVPGR